MYISHLAGLFYSTLSVVPDFFPIPPPPLDQLPSIVFARSILAIIHCFSFLFASHISVLLFSRTDFFSSNLLFMPTIGFVVSADAVVVTGALAPHHVPGEVPDHRPPPSAGLVGFDTNNCGTDTTDRILLKNTATSVGLFLLKTKWSGSPQKCWTVKKAG